jgi:carboxyl-terminal processing protease
MTPSLKKFGLVAAGAVAGVLVSVGLSAVAQRDSRPNNLPLDELRQFSDVFGAIKSYYVEPVEDKKLIEEAISGMVAGLDPHSSYLDADAFKELQAGTQGEFGGLGIEVGSEDGFVKVVSPIEDTPAARAGIKSGDLIIKIDDKSTKGLQLNDAVKLMRGKPKSSVVLTVLRKGEGKPLVFTLVRDVIKVQSVRSKVLDNGVGYLRITQLQALYKEGPLKSLILDLRNDPGGVLHGAVGVSAAFLPARTLVVSTDGRTQDAQRKYLADPADYLRGRGEDVLGKLPAGVKTVPMVVLVNGGSASASEIVAGALQDHKRAQVLGTQTFGKGSVQTILPLGNSAAVKLTTARYFTPSGRSIQAKGVTPDWIVEETADGESNVGRMRESDLRRHLSNPKESEDADPVQEKVLERAVERGGVKGAEKVIANQAERKPVEFGSAEDFQLQQALNLLRGQPVQTLKKDEVAGAESTKVSAKVPSKVGAPAN